MKDAIVFHHSADSSQESQYEKIRAYHNRGAPDTQGKLKWPAGYGCQYHFFIEKSGEIVQGNETERTTWHTGHWLWNKRSIGICLAGNFLTDKITGEQLRAACNLTNSLQARFGIQDSMVVNHFGLKRTECPGKRINDLVFEERVKHVDSRIHDLRKVIDRTEPPRKLMLERLLHRLLRFL
jgi:N-acetyl-anhydromuramyl-L-alanine amidase AmpD